MLASDATQSPTDKACRDHGSSLRFPASLEERQMIALRRHSARDYAEFPDIDAPNVGTLGKGDQACLGEIGHCLLQANAQARFGAALLHSHFPIESGETFVEDLHADAELITLRRARDAPSGLFATSVRFDDANPSSGEFRLVGLEFASEQVLAGVFPINDLDRDTLTSVGRILRDYGKTKRFGIRLLHDPLKLNGRVLLESCDSFNRILTCRSTAEDDPSFVQSIATVFRWEEAWAEKEDGLVVGQECMQFCKSIQRCERRASGSHRGSSSHDSTHREI
jgi:hypothetical protein